MKPTILVTILLILFFVPAVFAQTNNGTGDLAGKTFTIKLKKLKVKRNQVGWNWKSDELSFEDNQMTSQFMGGHEKFNPGTVASTTDADGTIHFKCHLSNNAVSTLNWEGTVKGSMISGKVIWHNANGNHSYQFHGNLK